MSADVLAGHTRISTQALAATARGVAADVFGVPAPSVRVALNDEYGELALALNLPLPIGRAGGTPRRPLWDRARDERTEVRDRFIQLTGSRVARVDVRVTGIILDTSRRAS
ncbi:hypothetical protein ACQ3I4_09545 [Zafaria sp. Z1313]|uniref:hypothetical protein n=1 Tax=unclassified Zafaria TaxID=2828765 RepID=UPI002E78B11D|nr:hypothetical protein [Zafaria sp. J156]MEE1621838.1 hypothetical protein [Zafaria sp. J156]